MKKRVTILDIAKDCGLSKSTVAYALSASGKGKVALEKRKLIKQSAAKLGYRANLSARGLSSHKTYSIGVLLPSPRDDFFADMIAKIQHLLSKTNYAPVFAFWETRDEIKKALNHILSRQVDAIITCEPNCIPDDLNIPVVAYRNPDERFDYVGYSASESTKMCLDYLSGLGHKKVAYIGPPNSAVSPRMQEFLKQVKERGLINMPEWNQLQPGTSENVFSMGAASLEKIWAFKEHPTAILTSDSIAIGAIRKAWEMKIKVPEELSIIGFGGTEHAQYSIPGLTTVKLADTKSIVSIILDKAFKRIKDNSLPRSETIINCKLLIRESCAKIVT